MNKSILILSGFLLTLMACNNGNITDPQDGIPVVKSEASYTVMTDEDIVYCQGLSHESINSSEATEMDQYLDIYYPDNDLENRPLYVFIHGGSFKGGSRKTQNIVDMANYFASRGWVFASIDYRVLDDKGTLPLAWVIAASAIQDSDDAEQFLAMYPAHRDGKAALRWIVSNADSYNIDTDYITVGGGSAGAIISITMGISEDEDYRDELTLIQDPTLASTTLDETYEVKTIIDFWGSKLGLDVLEILYGHQRFNSNDPPIFIAHGTEDQTVPYSSAEELVEKYDSIGVAVELVPLVDKGHAVWNATVDGKSLSKLSFDFIVEQQNLNLE